MAGTTLSADCGYYSSLADDPDLCDLVEMFAGEMQDRTLTLRNAMEREDWAEVARFAHQIKGAGGSYGFHQLTPFAAHAEQVAKAAQSPLEIHAAVELLCEACSRVRSGQPTPGSVDA